MGYISTPSSTRFREALIGRLLRQVLDRYEADAPALDILRTCAGIAQAEELTDDEMQWLLSAVESQLGIRLQ